MQRANDTKAICRVNLPAPLEKINVVPVFPGFG